jgi:hypothetical protein
MELLLVLAPISCLLIVDLLWSRIMKMFGKKHSE